MKIKSRGIFNQFFETVLSIGYIPKLTLPSRLTQNSGTLIDNFLCKISNNFSNTTAGICTQKLSDHQPYFICLDYLNISHKLCKYVKISKCSNESITKFIDFLTNQDLIAQLQSNTSQNPNDLYGIFNKILQLGIKDYIPTKTVKFHKHKHCNNRWITNGIVRSIKYRDKLYYRLKKTEANSDAYVQLKLTLSTYNKILKKAIKNAKILYYKNQFNKYRNNIKQTWKIINGVINKSHEKSPFSEYFLINNQKVKNKKSIADSFNKFYTDLGSKLANRIQQTQNLHINDYLLNEIHSKFNFVVINEDETVKIIETLKSKPSCGVDNISINLIKKLGMLLLNL